MCEFMQATTHGVSIPAGLLLSHSLLFLGLLTTCRFDRHVANLGDSQGIDELLQKRRKIMGSRTVE
jgi:hypothetical protein